MSGIADFTDSELWIINSTLAERYGAPRDIQLAETELRLDKGSTQLVPCPTAYWEDEDCHFVVCKTGDRRYRCQFFYRLHQMYGTGIEEYDDLSECVVSLLQVQADHRARERSGEDPD
ncbi:MAG: hypothetical protein PVG38_03085 [Gammaproteobacteria bacterium]|jgi:hypothetical protein